MSKNFVDVKHSVWERYHFKDDTDMENLVELIKDFGIPTEEEEGFIECETLYDTLEEMSLNDNSGFSTIEVIKDNETIYQNGI